MYGCIDEWIDRWMNGCMHAQMDDGWMGLWVDKQMDECAGLQPIEEGQGMRKMHPLQASSKEDPFK